MTIAMFLLALVVDFTHSARKLEEEGGRCMKKRDGSLTRLYLPQEEFAVLCLLWVKGKETNLSLHDLISHGTHQWVTYGQPHQQA